MMVFSKAAGVMFSLDVTNGNDKVVTIEGSYGLGEMVVQGAVTPDNFVVDKATGDITRPHHLGQARQDDPQAEGDVEEVEVPADERKQVITDDQIKGARGLRQAAREALRLLHGHGVGHRRARWQASGCSRHVPRRSGRARRPTAR